MEPISAIQLAPITSPEHLDRAKEIYLNAFPVSEQRPWSQLAEKAADLNGANPALEGIFRAGELIGLVTTWRFDRFMYVEHLAIDPAARGNNYGGDVVELLKARGQQHGRPIVLEVEPADESDPASLPSRRIRFYSRKGLRVVDRSYIQPPYSTGLPEVPLWIMSTDESIDTARVAATLHCEVYGKNTF